MNRNPHTARALLAALLAGMTGAAAAQVGLPPQPTVTYTMVSAPLPIAEIFRCQVTNVSSQSVTLVKLQIFSDTVVAQATCAGPGATLSPGATCKVLTPSNPYPGSITPHCRAQFTGPKAQAVVGSLHSTYTSGGFSGVVAVPMQLVEGITLAP